MHQFKSVLSKAEIIFSIPILSSWLIISPYKTRTEVWTQGNEKSEVTEMSVWYKLFLKVELPSSLRIQKTTKMCSLVTNSATLTTIS